MSTTSRTFTNNDLGTLLSTALSAVTSGTSDSLTIPVDSGLPAAYPYRVLVEWGTANWEVIQVNSFTSFNSGANTNTYSVTRDIDTSGVRTTSPSHSVGVPIIQGVSSQDFVDANAAAVIVGAYTAASPGFVLVTQGSGVPAWQAIPAATVPVTFTAALSAGSIVLVKNTTGSPTTGNLLVQNQTAGDKAFGIYVASDAAYRLGIDSTGKLQWGSGAAAADLNLYRSGAGILQTDNNMVITGNLTVNGKLGLASLITAETAVTTTFSMTVNSNTVLANATSAAFTVTLPTPTAGLHATIIKTDVSANLVTVATPSGTINGASTYTALTAQYKSAMFVSDGTNWFTESHT
jgi:hypothetical protein